MGIKLSEQTQKLRRLAIHGENLQSHVLHVGYLVLPDLMGVGSVVPLASSHPDELKMVIGLHRLANEFSDLTTGRTTHPQRLIPGGFTKLPTEDELKAVKQRVLDSENDVKAVTNLLKSLAHKLPNFTRETEYVSLTHDDEYALYDGDMQSTDGGKEPVEKYLEWTNEYVVPQSTAKYTKRKRDSLMVGALARFNNNSNQLKPKAKAVAEELGLKAPCYNPYMNTVAQYVECVHTLEDSVDIIDDLLKTGINYDEVYPKVTPKAGRGVGVVEVPRGINIHDYTYDEEGKCIATNIIIPTNQNHANIQLDLEKLVPEVMDKPKDEVELTLEMLVRAYDPCISCSTHYLKVEFKDE
jgi:coenzyme F420-reducing hydrogenase alpha subunit